MPVIAFSHYNLRGDRRMLDALRDFYIDVVGLQLGERPPFAHFGYWLYIDEQAVLHLSEARPGEVREANAAGTFDHVAFACTDRASFEAHLESRAIRYRSSNVPLTGQRQLFFVDPAGNGVELNFAEEDRG
ncbi:diguanylate cyclase [Trinickia sp. LjRoot230]|uniref:VOC family protein n=1 Tax=Trinickia sp. LjRoot230 TaxID=3342288 RepID=UPI003ED0CD1E